MVWLYLVAIVVNVLTSLPIIAKIKDATLLTVFLLTEGFYLFLLAYAMVRV